MFIFVVISKKVVIISNKIVLLLFKMFEKRFAMFKSFRQNVLVSFFCDLEEKKMKVVDSE